MLGPTDGNPVAGRKQGLNAKDVHPITSRSLKEIPLWDSMTVDRPAR